MWSRAKDALAGALQVFKRLKSVSFSLYGEDIALAVALQPRAKGFYVDVGAFAPAHLSNTYKLYLRGWRGVTVEPNPDRAHEFRRLRPRDVHCVVGVAETDSALTYHRFDEPTLNTFDPAQADIWRSHGHAALGTDTIPCRPLGAILAEVAPDEDIDLLCVDCEGFDLAVLKSHDWTRRPAAILVEDYERFQALKTDGPDSAIGALLRGLDYAPIVQTMFSFLWVDRAVLSRRRACAGFDMSRSQAVD